MSASEVLRRAHDWHYPIHPHGRYRGRPMRQRQCSRCELWETPYSLAQPCSVPAESGEGPDSTSPEPGPASVEYPDPRWTVVDFAEIEPIVDRCTCPRDPDDESDPGDPISTCSIHGWSLASPEPGSTRDGTE